MEESNSTYIDLQDLRFHSDTFVEELQKAVVECEPSCTICYKLIIQLRRHTRQAHSIPTQDETADSSSQIGLSSKTNDSDHNVRRSSRNRKKINYAGKIVEARRPMPETTKFIIEDIDYNNMSLITEEDIDIKYEAAEFSDPVYDENENFDTKSDDEEAIITTKTENKKINTQFPCKFCELSFTIRSKLYRHCFDVHAKEVDVDDCKICGEKFSEKKSLTNHILLNHKEILAKPYKCTICDSDASFYKPVQLQKHLEQIHPTLLHFVCKICDKSFFEQCELNNHILTHGSDIEIDTAITDADTHEKLLGCNVCKQAFHSTKSLSCHLRRKHKNILTPKYSCRVCKEGFFAHIQLTQHFNKLHPEDQPFECRVCHKLFKEENIMLIHAKVHTGEKTFSCTHCTKTFRTGTQLTRHLRVHTGEKPYGCDECGKYFSATGSLHTHRRIHTGEKPYMCEQCSKCFRTSVQLNQHALTHAVEGGVRVKLHVCKECGKRFTTKSGLSTHSVIHSKKKPHQCEECGKCFALPHQLRAHCKTHTGE